MRAMDQFSAAAGKPASPGDLSARGSAGAGQFDTEFEPGGPPSAAFAAGASGRASGAASGDSDPASEQDAVEGRRDGTPSGAAQAWAALGGDPALLGRVSYERRPGVLPSALPVRELASAAVAVCSLAAAEFSCVRARSALLPPVRVDDGAVATAFHSDRLVRVDGDGPAAFAPLSRFWRTADGWVRTHANYPHHRARLLSALGMDDHGPAEDEAAAGRVATELASRRAREVEEVVFREGGLAVVVRTPEEWVAHPQRQAVAAAPLVAVGGLDAAPTPALEGPPGPGGLRGLRVLDLTRVLAGPVATRTLALLGADVLRVDAPERPEFPGTHADTGLGKRSTLLDLSSRAGQATFEELLASAHVVVTGYRPGALDRFGLAPESLMDRRPGLVVGQLSAWGPAGPWQRRRGFDSLVQAATGIAAVEAAEGAGGNTSSPDLVPGALPAQALDHGSGYLLAAGLLRALTEQRTGTAGSRLVRLSLARTAHWLLHDLPGAPLANAARQSVGGAAPGGVRTARGAQAAAEPPLDHAPWLTEADSPLGRLRYALPAVGFGTPARAGGPREAGGTPDAACSPRDWARVPGLVGGDSTEWI
ncbi:CoA transferase [Streptomyces tubbatahanensis]|uniref:CoA transferase n=1 Tax=Streptomyces tubbatahanensis TaxID=2923272 RepID=A0ABY3XZJ6_9ACTN|nr:CoA transferase [Streptomyces tubbatahanensis]UNS99976.1 CoA transferase [Streptomyces tubbatahanensis]